MKKPQDQHEETSASQSVDSHHRVLSELDSANPSAAEYPAEEIIDHDLAAAEEAESEQGTGATAEATLANDTLALKEKLAAAEEKANLYLDHLKRVQAEIENSRHRAERDIAKAHKFALEKIVADLLPVTDSLERGLTEIAANSGSLDSLQQGTELTLSMLLKVLSKHKVTQINPIGELFNPELHEAMSIISVPDAKPNTVHQVLQKGYLLNERLVRPAMVIVTKA